MNEECHGIEFLILFLFLFYPFQLEILQVRDKKKKNIYLKITNLTSSSTLFNCHPQNQSHWISIPDKLPWYPPPNCPAIPAVSFTRLEEPPLPNQEAVKMTFPLHSLFIQEEKSLLVTVFTRRKTIILHSQDERHKNKLWKSRSGCDNQLTRIHYDTIFILRAGNSLGTGGGGLLTGCHHQRPSWLWSGLVPSSFVLVPLAAMGWPSEKDEWEKEEEEECFNQYHSRNSPGIACGPRTGHTHRAQTMEDEGNRCVLWLIMDRIKLELKDMRRIYSDSKQLSCVPDEITRIFIGNQ